MNIILHQLFVHENKQFCIYGDAAYNIKPWILMPFVGDNLTDDQKNFNACMSSVKVAVEISFEEAIQYWTSQDVSKRFKVRHALVGLLYQCSALLWNLRVCSYGCSQIAQQFQVSHRSIDECLHQ